MVKKLLKLMGNHRDSICALLPTILYQLLPLQSLPDFWFQQQGISIAEHLPSTQLPSNIPDHSICMQLQQHVSPTMMHTQSYGLASVFQQAPFAQMNVHEDQFHPGLFVPIPVRKHPTPCLRLSCLGKCKDRVQADDLAFS